MFTVSRVGRCASSKSTLLTSLSRGFATQLKKKRKPLPAEVFNALPVYSEPPDDSIPEGAHPRAPVTSAHCIDVAKQEVSKLDSAAISPSGGVVHGKYGELGDAATAIPLEYLALLRPAAEGCAALRVVTEKSKAEKGTLLVFGAGEPSGLAAAQVASAKGHAVVAVVGNSHSGNEDFVESLKGLISEPGTAVPEEYALSKANFRDLVTGISSGKDGSNPSGTSDEYLQDFYQNFIAQCAMYPDTRPAAVSAKHMEFEYMEKDREFWEQNMEAYLEQFPPGAPPVDPAKLRATFNIEQYEIFKRKFWHQTTSVISGEDLPFSPPHIVQDQIAEPESLGLTNDQPYAFSVVNQEGAGDEVKPAAGGPVMGAILCVNEDLQIAAGKVAEAKTKRAKAEALQFLTDSQRSAFGSACSVVAQATKAGAPVVVVGGNLPDLPAPIAATDDDVNAALNAMDVQEDGSTHLNYFCQTYRAADFPFYADYAVHRASEPLAGPRQLIVTK